MCVNRKLIFELNGSKLLAFTVLETHPQASYPLQFNPTRLEHLLVIKPFRHFPMSIELSYSCFVDSFLKGLELEKIKIYNAGSLAHFLTVNGLRAIIFDPNLICTAINYEKVSSVDPLGSFVKSHVTKKQLTFCLGMRNVIFNCKMYFSRI